MKAQSILATIGGTPHIRINRLFPGQSLNTTEPPPGTYRTWQRSI